MFVNNCPKHSESHHSPNHHCVARFLGRLAFEPLRNNPLFGPSSRTLVKLGSLEWCRVVEEHEAWRLFTCIWLHVGVIHLVANMISLLFVGIRLEQQFGFVRIGVIYVTSGVGGSVVALLTLLFVIVINLALGILPHVDNMGHLGGFVVGFLLGFVLLARPRFKWLAREHIPEGRHLTSKYKPYQYILRLISLALLISGFVVALVMLFRGEEGNDHCRWCRYLRCIPTSKWSCEDV
ncbi:hypothetical protein Bca4012_000333 [Brassica carinata]